MLPYQAEVYTVLIAGNVQLRIGFFLFLWPTVVVKCYNKYVEFSGKNKTNLTGHSEFVPC